MAAWLAIRPTFDHWLLVRVVALAHCLLLVWCAAAEAQPVVRPGVVVVKVAERSALARAGVQPGDLILAWRRPPSLPANPKEARGELESILDWGWLEVEQSHRGMVELSVRRSGELRVLRAEMGPWAAEVRPRLADELVQHDSTGRRLLEAGAIEQGVASWRRLAEAGQAVGCRDLQAWSLLRIGDGWVKAQQWQRADMAYQAALAAVDDPLGEVVVWRAIADARAAQGSYKKAAAAYRRELETRERTWGMTVGGAVCLQKIGQLAISQGKLGLADEPLVQALTITEELAPESLVAARGLLLLGSARAMRLQLERAGEALSRSLSILERLAPGGVDMVSTLNSLGYIASESGRPTEAAEHYRRALKIAEQLDPGSLTVAGLSNNLGTAAEQLGRTEEAEELLRRSLSIRERLAPESPDTATTLNNLGQITLARGRTDEAEDYYLRALEILTAVAPESPILASCLAHLGNVAQVRSQHAKAADYHERALELRERLEPDSLSVAYSLGNLGSVALFRGRLDQAREYNLRALSIFERRTPDSLNLVPCLLNLGLTSLKPDQAEQAIAYFNRALEIQQRLAPDSARVGTCLRLLAHAALLQEQYDQAFRLYQRALAITRERTPEGREMVLTLHEMAAALRGQGRTEEATRVAAQALDLLDGLVDRLGGSHGAKAGFRASFRDCYRQHIELLVDSNRDDEAFYSLERYRARALLEMLAERVINLSKHLPEELDRKRRQLVSRYDRLQSELLRLGPEHGKARVDQIRREMKQARDRLDEIAEQVRELSPRLAALHYPQPLKLAAVQESLEPGVIMLSYSVGKEQVQLFVVDHQAGLRVVTLPGGEQALRAEVEAFHALIESVRPGSIRSESLIAAARDLYRKLIEPVEPWLEGAERLVLVPDGPLHVLPFGALVRPAKGGEPSSARPWQYLVEWKPVSFVQSATLYQQLQGSRQRPGVAASSCRQPVLIAFGDPHYPSFLRSHSSEQITDPQVRSVTERGFEFTPLPASRFEVERIARLYPERAIVHLGKQATEEQAKAKVTGARLVHFAAHAVLDEQLPLSSAVALTIPIELTEGRDNGLLQAWEIIEGVRLDADMVVISACRSGLGREIAGEGLIGLTRAFLAAGAQSVVSSLWAVPDESTAELMVRFYRHLEAGKSKDEALRAAQLELIQGPISAPDPMGRPTTLDASAPWSWAAFQLTGDWRQRCRSGLTEGDC